MFFINWLYTSGFSLSWFDFGLGQYEEFFDLIQIKQTQTSFIVFQTTSALHCSSSFSAVFKMWMAAMSIVFFFLISYFSSCDCGVYSQSWEPAGFAKRTGCTLLDSICRVFWESLLPLSVSDFQLHWLRLSMWSSPGTNVVVISVGR